jgi:hypothetical protein
MSYLAYFSRETLAIVFGVAVISKLRSRSSWRGFKAATADLLGVGSGLGSVLAVITVSLEVASAVTLVADRFARIGVWLALALSTALLAVVLQGVLRRVKASCNCFGSSGDQLGWMHVWRNVLLATVAAAGVIGVSTTASAPSLVPSFGVSVPIVLGLFVAAALISWEDVAFLAFGSLSTGASPSHLSEEA